MSENGTQPSELLQAATPASAFRQARVQGEPIRIQKTGRVVYIRPVKPATLLRQGDVPDPLSELVMRILYGQLTQEEYREFFTLPERKERALELTESLRIVCTAALVYPRVVNDPQTEDEIHIDDLEDDEQRTIFELALMEASDLRRFRLRQGEDVEDLAPVEDLELPAEPVAQPGE